MVYKDDHVTEIEIFIRSIKESNRATWKMLPFNNIPNGVIVDIVTVGAMWLNMFPPTDGISTSIIPRTLVTGLKINNKNHFRIDFV